MPLKVTKRGAEEKALSCELDVLEEEMKRAKDRYCDFFPVCVCVRALLVGVCTFCPLLVVRQIADARRCGYNSHSVE